MHRAGRPEAGEEEVVLVDDVAVLEVYSGQRAADLGAQLDLLDGGELTEEAQPRADLAHQRLADHDLGKRGRSDRGDSIALTIRVGEPCGRQHRDRRPGRDPSFRA